jgi:hypothetical protein
MSAECSAYGVSALLLSLDVKFVNTFCKKKQSILAPSARYRHTLLTCVQMIMINAHLFLQPHLVLNTVCLRYGRPIYIDLYVKCFLFCMVLTQIRMW